MKNVLFAALAGLALFTISCKDNNDPGDFSATDKNNLTLEFDNRVGGQKLILGQTTAKNASGEDFTITMLNYYVSNVALTKDDGSVVKFPNQYFLIRQEDATSLNAILKDVPAGNYKQISFVVGVDSARSVSDVSQRTGVLDVAGVGGQAMYWSWNSGYIFLRVEGTSPAAPINAAGLRPFQLHIGGFGGYSAPSPSNLRTVTLSTGTTEATVRKDIAPDIHFYVDAAKIFDGVNKISLATTYMIHNPALGKPIADNYVTMFEVDHVHNDKSN